VIKRPRLNLTTELHPEPRLIMCRVLHPLSHTSSWRGTQEQTYFTLLGLICTRMCVFWLCGNVNKLFQIVRKFISHKDKGIRYCNWVNVVENRQVLNNCLEGILWITKSTSIDRFCHPVLVYLSPVPI
jgi:hypothetical protein